MLLISASGLLLAQQSKSAELILGETFAPLVIIGEGWSQQIIIHNQDREGEALTGTLEFFTANGEPWTVDLLNQGSGNRFFVTLLPGQMAIYETVVKTHGQILGFAHLDLDCCAYHSAQTVFRKQTAGRPDLMTSTPLADYGLRALHIPFDNRGGKFAGVGVVNLNTCFSFECETRLRYRFRDMNGNVFKEITENQKNFTLKWFSLTSDHPEVNGMVGTLEITAADEDLARLQGFSLQFAPNGAFTVISTLEQ
jgi:hypothetical protein